MSFTRDWDGTEFDTEDEAYNDYQDNFYLVILNHRKRESNFLLRHYIKELVQ